MVVVSIDVSVALGSVGDIVAEVTIAFVATIRDISDAIVIVAAERGKSVRLDGKDLQVAESRNALYNYFVLAINTCCISYLN